MKRTLSILLCLILVCGTFSFAGAVFEQKPAENFTLQLPVKYHQTEARKVFTLLNEFRTGSDAWYWNETDDAKVKVNGLQPMQYDASLEQIAMQRAAELVVQMAHLRPDGTQCFTAFGAYQSAAENIAAGQETAQEVHTAWCEENESYAGQGHRRVMLSGALVAVGIGCVEYDGRYYWAEAFKTTYQDEVLSDPIDLVKTVDVNVAASQVEEYAVSSSIENFLLKPGDKISLPASTLSLKLTYSLSTQSIPLSLFWRSSDVTIASVNDGAIFAVKEGSCNLCADLHGQTIEYPIKVLHQHMPEVLPPVTATCLTTGLSAGSRCRTCGEIIKAQTVVPVQPHSFVTKTTRAKYQKDGRIVKTCSVCGLRQVVDIPQIKTIKLSDKTYTYDGSKHKPKVRLIDSEGNVLRRDRDYTLTYPSGMKKVGTYDIVVKLIGNYKGSKTLTYKILPAGVRNLKAVPGVKSAALSWDPADGATDYIVYYSETKKGGYSKLGSTQKTSASMIQLDSGKTYYFRIRSVTRSGSDQWNGPLCSPVAVKAK